MRVVCEVCRKSYDDVYRLTYCPHETFEMRTVVADGSGGVLGVATTVEEVDRLIEKGREKRRDD